MPDSPLIIAGTGSRAWRAAETASAALAYAAGGRKDVQLYIGDCPTGGDILLRTGAVSLGWPRPRVFAANWRKLGRAAGPERNSRIATAEPKAHAGIALLCAGLRNTGTLDCATKLVRAGIPVTCWCDECGPVPLVGPCETHSIAEVLGTWHVRTQRASQLTRQPTLEMRE